MKNTLEQDIGTYAQYQAAAQKAQSVIFSEHLDELYQRLHLFCKISIMDEEKPISCCEYNSIRWGIAGNTINDLKNRVYPASKIRWEFSENLIAACITSLYKGEIDASIRIDFPVNSHDFDKFVNELRLEKLAIIQQKNNASQIARDIETQREKEQLKILMEKYPSIAKEMI
jgi:hypothetical protein